MVNGEVIHGYDAYGRRTELRTASGSRTFTYDVQNRVASIGNSGGSLHYTYRSGLQQLNTASWRNGEGAELNSRTFAYDSYHRLTGIKLNGVSEVGYSLNDRDQRTAVQYPGVNWNCGYDDKGQLTGAEKSAGDVSETYSYTYDGIGNRLTAQEGASQFSYTSNLLNQYTQVNTAQPTYEADGNMLTTGDGWTYAWNGENRLVRAEKDGTVVEMNYDYAGRRFEKKVYVNSGAGTSGTLQHHYKYVYDGYKLVELYDNDTLLASFTWQPESVGGLDVPVSMVYEGDTYYYVTDGNKNVTALLDAAGFRVAGYTYGPFGQVLSMDGALAEVNPFRFSSEFHDDETGLVYYNYRYYSPSLGRWTKRAPIGEAGGLNSYVIVNNSIIDYWDNWGLVLYAFDGTGNYKNILGGYTNVYRLYTLYNAKRHYMRGVGTGGSFDQIHGGITGYGGKARLKAMLRALIQEYKNGNTVIDIIGFSRGAALAREFANMINEGSFFTGNYQHEWNRYGRLFTRRVFQKCPEVRFLAACRT